jgi:hypothetical protein
MSCCGSGNNFSNVAKSWTSKSNLNFSTWNPYPELSGKNCQDQTAQAYKTQFPVENFSCGDNGNGCSGYISLSKTYSPIGKIAMGQSFQ